ncbi:hypothetical protein PR202_ga29740 [Eleusine coracana subsp. coracana]|uniref:Uncharacterized protein n=1 Tax=Eleusine coracana subsp. coracana TaxID=191504 RepID=A0AAV5DMX2_ELECO|nr:hypothetical protein PR202_ga29740 [Eleusine coracana subsp. coracana]
MASPPPIAKCRPPQPLPTITGDLLEEILFRLPTPTDLARVHRLRLLPPHHHRRRLPPPVPRHPPASATRLPPLPGSAPSSAGFYPAQTPHPSAPLARALADATDFSYSFVPTGRWLTPWRTRDVRQGRVLIKCCPEDALDQPFLDMRPGDLVLAVCDPISWRYLLLPTIPGDLASGNQA